MEIPAPSLDFDDLISPREMAYLEAKEGPVFAAWELCERWLRAWRELHPEDDRDDLELILEEYR